MISHSEKDLEFEVSFLNPNLIIFGFLGLLIVFLAIWLSWREPTPQTVFYEMLSNNLKTAGVSLETEVTTEIKSEQPQLILKNNLVLDFKKIRSYFYQDTLTFHQDLADYFLDQSQQNQRNQTLVDNQIKSPPQMEWYTQETKTDQDLVYARHHLYSQPPVDNWSEIFSNNFDEIRWDNIWHKKDLSQTDLPLGNYHHFLMLNTATTGFLYGNLNSDQRQKLLKSLKKAYQVDWDSVRVVYDQSGRGLYEYQLTINFTDFAQAFVDYFNFHIPDPKFHLQIKTQALNDFFVVSNSPIYKIQVDIWSKNLRQINYSTPLLLAQPLRYTKIANDDFVIIPFYSHLINSFALSKDRHLQSLIYKTDLKSLAQPQIDYPY